MHHVVAALELRYVLLKLQIGVRGHMLLLLDWGGSAIRCPVEGAAHGRVGLGVRRVGSHPGGVAGRKMGLRMIEMMRATRWESCGGAVGGGLGEVEDGVMRERAEGFDGGNGTFRFSY